MNFRSYDRNDQLQPLESHFTGVGRVRAVIGKETLNLQTNTALRLRIRLIQSFGYLYCLMVSFQLLVF